MKNAARLLLWILGVGCTVVFLSFQYVTKGRGPAAENELRVGLVDPWLVRRSKGTGPADTQVRPLTISGAAGVGALVFLGTGLLRRRNPTDGGAG